VGRSQRRCAWAFVRLALVLAPVASAYAASALAPEPPTDRVLIRFRNAAAIPRITMPTANSASEQVGALSIRRATPLRYVRTIYSGAHTAHLGRFMHGAELTALVARLAADSDVEMVAPDRLKRALNTVPNDPRYGANNGDPNGTYTQQWYLLPPNSTLISPINAEAAWDLSRGSASIPVAVVDTGVLFRHPDLGMVAHGGKLLPGYDMIGPDSAGTTPPFTYYVANDGNGRDPDPTDPGDWINTTDQTSSATKSLFGGKDASGNPECPISPSSWHGTSVAGVIGASTNDGVGVSGVGWNAPVLPVRALGKCGGYDSDILDGMAWAAGLALQYPDPSSASVPTNPNPVRIINLSLGSPTPCGSFYQSLLTQLTAMNVLVVAAAGNDGQAVSEPANCPDVVAVAALRHAGTKVAFSGLGPEVAISAPGGNCSGSTPGVATTGACLYSVVSNGNTGTEAASDSGMTYVDGNQPPVSYSGQSFAGGGVFGTSLSAPMVSGVIALMLAANPNLTAAQVISALKSSARPFPAPPGVVSCTDSTATTTQGGIECGCTTSTCGAGMLDAYGAVLAAMGDPANPTKLPAPTPISPPLIPPQTSQIASLPPSSGGGGGADAPWWILTLLAAGTMRARAATTPRAGRGYGSMVFTESTR
jgi:serine protease